MLVQRIRRWTNTETTLGKSLKILLHRDILFQGTHRQEIVPEKGNMSHAITRAGSVFITRLFFRSLILSLQLASAQRFANVAGSPPESFAWQWLVTTLIRVEHSRLLMGRVPLINRLDLGNSFERYRNAFPQWWVTNPDFCVWHSAELGQLRKHPPQGRTYNLMTTKRMKPKTCANT